MKLHFLKLVWVMLGAVALLAANGCRSTAHGFVHDTERNAAAVGRGVENVGEKIQDSTR